MTFNHHTLDYLIQQELRFLQNKFSELQNKHDLAIQQTLYENLLSLNRELNSTILPQEKDPYLLMYQGEQAFDR